MFEACSNRIVFLFLLLHLYQVYTVSGISQDNKLSEHSWSETRLITFNFSDSNKTSIPSNCLICNVGAAYVQYEDSGNQTGTTDEFLSCMTESSQEPGGLADQVYNLDNLPSTFTRRYRKQLYSGKSRICIRQGRIHRRSHQIVIPNATSVEILPDNAGSTRRLISSTGRTTALVVRVTSTFGEDPGLPATLLEGSIFGTGTSAQSVSMVSQFAACSQGKFLVVPATGNNIVNGVLDVVYPGQLAGKDVRGELESVLNNLVTTKVGVKKLSNAANHVMYCLPDGGLVNGNSTWIAFSYVNGMISYFQQGWCQYLTAQMHEFSHQIGLEHSGSGNREYGDSSCIMGVSYGQTGGPKMCFNGHKNWLLGWFDDRKVFVSPPWVGNLVSFVDYSLIGQVQNGVAIIKTGFLYIQLNTKKSYNAGVPGYGNQVTVVENTPSAKYSNLLVGLSSGQSYVYSNYGGSGIGLVVKICSINFGSVSFAKVSLHLNDGIQTSQCPSPVNPLPSPFPTRLPTTSPPTLRPTPLPTRLATSPPSRRPTPRPTPQPTTITTSPPTPTPRPTPLPATRLPTPLPTGTPTRLPTFQPTPFPTTQPTPQPTIPAPLPQPTPLPTFQPVPKPSRAPRTRYPRSRPTLLPTLQSPTAGPTKLPTPSPTATPSISPTKLSTPPPQVPPSASPTTSPTSQPITLSPSHLPTSSPTRAPVLSPTATPTSLPSSQPVTQSPTPLLTLSPTSSPTALPTQLSTNAPSPPITSPTATPVTPKPSARPQVRSTPKPRRRSGPPSSSSTNEPSMAGSTRIRRALNTHRRNQLSTETSRAPAPVPLKAREIDAPVCLS